MEAREDWPLPGGHPGENTEGIAMLKNLMAAAVAALAGSMLVIDKSSLAPLPGAMPIGRMGKHHGSKPRYRHERRPAGSKLARMAEEHRITIRHA